VETFHLQFTMQGIWPIYWDVD